jgi:hypothetical protein
LRQAILSRDFQRNIYFNGPLSTSQTVTYEPFREAQKLKARIAELEEALGRIQQQLQSEYDRHFNNYKKRGCRGCINGAWAVRDVARKLGIKIEESE